MLPWSIITGIFISFITVVVLDQKMVKKISLFRVFLSCGWVCSDRADRLPHCNCTPRSNRKYITVLCEGRLTKLLSFWITSTRISFVLSWSSQSLNIKRVKVLHKTTQLPGQSSSNFFIVLQTKCYVECKNTNFAFVLRFAAKSNFVEKICVSW